MERKFHLHDGKMGAAITVRVAPRAKRDAITGILEDGTVQIGLKSGQGEAQVNAALLAFLAEVLGVEAARLDIVAGLAGSDKLVTIDGLDGDTVHQRIMARAG